MWQRVQRGIRRPALRLLTRPGIVPLHVHRVRLVEHFPDTVRQDMITGGGQPPARWLLHDLADAAEADRCARGIL